MKMKNFLKCCEDLVIQESGASALELEKLKSQTISSSSPGFALHDQWLGVLWWLLSLVWDGFYSSYYARFLVNSDELWKDVWRDYASDYYFFGMSAIGDQFAYRLKDGNIQSNQVYYLDGITMDVIEIYDSFEAFF